MDMLWFLPPNDGDEKANKLWIGRVRTFMAMTLLLSGIGVYSWYGEPAGQLALGFGFIGAFLLWPLERVDEIRAWFKVREDD